MTQGQAETQLARKGWITFAADEATLRWATAARPLALAALSDPRQKEQWQCEDTWFVGVDALANDKAGRIGGVALAGPGPAIAQSLFGPLDLHPAQLSGVRPGYPRPRAGESPAAFRYRQRRDSAHVDGLLPTGRERRRVLGEPHAWILGLPLTDAADAAAPLVVWEGSHRMLGAALSAPLAASKPGHWNRVDLTEIYQSTRREVFEACPRVTLPVRPGEAVLLHRHLLHGIAPWAAADTPHEPRVIAYFRPQFLKGRRRWLYAT